MRLFIPQAVFLLLENILFPNKLYYLQIWTLQLSSAFLNFMYKKWLLQSPKKKLKITNGNVFRKQLGVTLDFWTELKMFTKTKKTKKVL